MATVTFPPPGAPPATDPAGPTDYAPRTPEWLRRVPARVWWIVGVLALMVLTAYLRSRYLTHQFWIDEGITTGIALHPLSQIPHVLRFDGNPPLYYMLLHIWIRWFGDSAAATHSLSLLFGVLAVPAGAWGAERMFGTRAGWMAALLFAFNAWLTAYAQETRMYELMALLGVIATPAYVLGFVYGRRRYLVLFGATLTAMLYTHSWGTFFFAGSLIALIPTLVASDDRRALLRDVLVTYVVAGALYLPWAPTLLFQVAHTAAPWDKPPRYGALIQISRNLLGGDRITVILGFSAVIGLGPLLTRSHRRTREATTVWTLILLPVAVLGLAWITSQANPAWAPRYFAPVLASLLFLLAWGCSRARALGIVAILFAVWYLHSPTSFAPNYKSNMRNINAELGARLHQRDLVIVGQPEQTPLAWYYLPAGLRFANTASNGQVLRDPRYQNWVDVLHHIDDTQPRPALHALLATLHPGQQLLFIRPLTEGVQNWEAPWTKMVRRRSAQWGADLSADVASGILAPEAYAPHNYHEASTVADSAVLYRVER